MATYHTDVRTERGTRRERRREYIKLTYLHHKFAVEVAVLEKYIARHQGLPVTVGCKLWGLKHTWAWHLTQSLVAENTYR